jgi:predicted XRE-type DNA-binding protein
MAKTMTQEQIAKILGVRQPAVSKMLNGEIPVSDRTKIILAYYLKNNEK